MTYDLIFSENAEEGMAKLKRSEPRAFDKLSKLLFELREHPRVGTGHPKPLGDDRQGQWVRRITGKHRLIYMIDDDKMTVIVASTWGHYDDK
jgi:toxin YoeB